MAFRWPSVGSGEDDGDAVLQDLKFDAPFLYYDLAADAKVELDDGKDTFFDVFHPDHEPSKPRRPQKPLLRLSHSLSPEEGDELVYGTDTVLVGETQPAADGCTPDSRKIRGVLVDPDAATPRQTVVMRTGPEGTVLRGHLMPLVSSSWYNANVLTRNALQEAADASPKLCAGGKHVRPSQERDGDVCIRRLLSEHNTKVRRQASTRTDLQENPTADLCTQPLQRADEEQLKAMLKSHNFRILKEREEKRTHRRQRGSAGNPKPCHMDADAGASGTPAAHASHVEPSFKKAKKTQRCPDCSSEAKFPELSPACQRRMPEYRFTQGGSRRRVGKEAHCGSKGPAPEDPPESIIDDELMNLLRQHNAKLAPKPAYEPRQHSVKAVKEWEQLHNKRYYELSFEARAEANKEITAMQRYRDSEQQVVKG